MRTLEPIDVAENAHLRGRFAPVRHEVTAEGLDVEGSLPRDLVGVYVRNGPNPAFTPLGSYTFPMEGDAMLHGVRFDGSTVGYRNRWVRTQGFRAEERAGRALFGGMLTPALVDPQLLGPDPDPGWPLKLDPFINVVRHAGRYLALAEGLPPYEVTEELDTVGRCDFGGRLAAGMCAHPRVDPVTGEMVVFRYDVEQPFLTWAVIDRHGAVTRPATPVEGVERPCMIHDFLITATSVVIVVAPLVLDVDALLKGGSPLRWRPEDGTRIAVIPRTGGPATWLHGDPFFAWHFANAYEDGADIVADLCWWSAPGLGLVAATDVRGSFARARLRPAAGTFEISHLEDRPCEFPRIDDRLTGRCHRHVTVARKSGRRDLDVGEFDRLVRYDLERGTSVSHDVDGVLGEVVFAPRAGSTDELDGYYLTFASDLGATRSELLVWDASDFPGDPLARVVLPQRVPNGLHGTWIPAG